MTQLELIATLNNIQNKIYKKCMQAPVELHKLTDEILTETDDLLDVIHELENQKQPTK